ncbi:MAG TPA: M4 family metallopeptidase [Actinomycetota bacterium]|nr:M4 family metallopeptidase [Actinomycetota bacterium]
MTATRRSRALLAIVGTAALLGAACKPAVLGTTGEPNVLQVSAAYRSAVTPDAFSSRARDLTRALRRLREETHSGWIGRQDDQTGYLAELRGGTFPADGDPEDVAGTFFSSWALALFGIEAAELAFAPGEGTAGGPVVLRAEQRLHEVPVVDGVLTVTVATPEASPRVSAVRGRVFPGLQVSAEAAITAARAGRLAEQASGGAARDPTLVVLPVGASGALAWEVFVVGAQNAALPSALYYVSADDGAILAVRPASVQFSPFSTAASAAAVAAQATEGEDVELTGQTPVGTAVTANGKRRGGKFLLIDTTTPTFDPATGRGGIETHDGINLEQEDLPGPVSSSDTAEVADQEALGAHVYSREIFDYYNEVQGRASWDGQGATVTSSVHFGGPEFCNAYFNGEQMVYGAPCEVAGEEITTFVDIDIAAHEVSHGVTATGSGLLYTGQSGAVNEALSDYFGNVIGNRFTGVDSVAIGEGGCVDIDHDTALCSPNPDGTRSIRYMLSGLQASDYAFLLDPPISQKLLGLRQDNGGVHLNSQIFNNTLWEIRTRLAQLDGTDGNTSARAQAFDHAVYVANTQIMTPTSSFLDTRAAIEQAARETGMDGESIRVIGQVFDLTGIVAANLSVPPSPAQSVVATSAAQKAPQSGGDTIAWIDYPGGEGLTGQAAFVSADGGAAPTALGTALTATSVAFAGHSLLVADDPGIVTLYGPAGGAAQVLDPSVGVGSLILGLAGSGEGAAWLNFENATLGFVDPSGTVTSAPVPPAATQSQPLSIGTGGGTVAVGSQGGNVIVWQAGGQPQLIQVPGGNPMAIDAFGDKLLVASFPGNLPIQGSGADLTCTVTLVDLTSGSQTVLSRNAMPFGVTIGQDYAIWTQAVQRLSGGVIGNLPTGEGAFQDTDLWLYSLGTGRTYSVLTLRGQQGYPSLEGDRLVWQEAAAGGDDVATGRLPSGL